MPIGEPMKKYLQVFNLFYKIKNIFLAVRGPLFRRALGPGFSGLRLKTALRTQVQVIRSQTQVQNTKRNVSASDGVK